MQDSQSPDVVVRPHFTDIEGPTTIRHTSTHIQGNLSNDVTYENMDHSQFATLPAELRDWIYDATLQFQGDEVHLNETNDLPWQLISDSSRWTRLGLLTACRQMHEEAAKRLYTVNTFSLSQKTLTLPCEEVLENFINRIGDTNAARLQTVHLSYTLTQGTFGNGQFRRSMKRIGQVAQRLPRCNIKVLLTFLDVYKSIAIRAELNIQTGLLKPGNLWIEVFEPITSASMENSTEVQDSMNFLRAHLRDVKQDLGALRNAEPVQHTVRAESAGYTGTFSLVSDDAKS